MASEAVKDIIEQHRKHTGRKRTKKERRAWMAEATPSAKAFVSKIRNKLGKR